MRLDHLLSKDIGRGPFMVRRLCRIGMITIVGSHRAFDSLDALFSGPLAQLVRAHP